MTGHPPRQRSGRGLVAAPDRMTPAQLAAIARAASGVADAGSLSLTLNALADAVRSSAGLAAAQVITLHGDGRLEVAGMSGFETASQRFSDQLAECRRRGADLVMLQVLRSCRPAVVLHRKARVMADPRWEPIHDLLSSADWDSFACLPLMVRQTPVGVLTAFYPPGGDPAPADLEFLSAMADQAAMAVDHAALLAASREETRRRERERIAQDLHDSVVHQVFSMRLYAGALATADNPDGRRVRLVADEICALATTALADLRDLIFQLRPAPLGEHGLVEAIRLHARAVADRTGLVVRVEAPMQPLDLHPDQEEDLYRILQEALHNVVKHAAAGRVDIRIDAVGPAGPLRLEITDDGCGPAAGRTEPGTSSGTSSSGLGVTSMRERARRWGGRLQLSAGPDGGTHVVAVLPRAADGVTELPAASWGATSWGAA